ncbi:MAG: PDZ domain-containing protein, partial [Acidobacteria bacterium]|nr:PDZ domain-containing protein [Acidobacteriota bacterium]
MRFSVNLKFIVVASAAVAALYLGCLNLRDRLLWEEISDGVAWKETGDGVNARRVKPGSGAEEAGIASGDVLVGINGRPVRDLDDYYQALDPIPPGSEALYLVRRAGAGAPLSRLVSLRMEPVFGATDVYLTLVALVYLVAGAVIFLRNWRGDFSFHFFLVCLLSFILYLFRHTGKAGAFDILAYWLSGSALLLLPVVFFHFCVNFPRRRSARTFRPLLVAGYGSAAALLAMHALWFGGYLRPLGIARDLFFRSLFDRLHLIYFTVGFAAGAAVLVYSRMRSESSEQRQQLKWILRTSLLGLLPFAAFYALPFALGSIPNHVQEMSILSLAVIPIGFAYAIVKYRLMDVDVIFKRGAAYFVAGTAVLAVYFALVLLAGRLLLAYLPNAGLLLFALAALVVAFLFRPLHGTVQGALDRLFYSVQYDYRRSFSDFGKTLSSEISLERLSSVLLQRLQK